MSTDNNKVLKSKVKYKLKNIPSNITEGEDVMTNTDYIEQSSVLINKALKKGYDVLQMDNGDIVTTGTKTIVYRYAWDEEKNQLTKIAQEQAEAGENFEELESLDTQKADA